MWAKGSFRSPDYLIPFCLCHTTQKSAASTKWRRNASVRCTYKIVWLSSRGGHISAASQAHNFLRTLVPVIHRQEMRVLAQNPTAAALMPSFLNAKTIMYREKLAQSQVVHRRHALGANWAKWWYLRIPATKTLKPTNLFFHSVSHNKLSQLSILYGLEYTKHFILTLNDIYSW